MVKEKLYRGFYVSVLPLLNEFNDLEKRLNMRFAEKMLLFVFWLRVLIHSFIEIMLHSIHHMTFKVFCDVVKKFIVVIYKS